MKNLKVKWWIIFMMIATFVWTNFTAAMGQEKLGVFKKANIDWTQCKGEHISILSIPHAYMLALEPHIPEFEKLTGIDVSIEMLGEVEMRRKRTIDLSMGAGLYDVLNIGLSIIPQYAQAYWLADLRPFLKDPKLTDNVWYKYEDIGEPFRKWNTAKDGRILAIPVNGSGPILWYRTDIFDKYGITPPDTWEEVVEMKKKLQAKLDTDPVYKGVYAYCMRAGRGAGANTWNVCPLIYDYGGKIFDEHMKAVFDSPEACKALEMYRALQVGYGNPPGSEGIDFYTMVDMFAAGNLASMFAGIDHIVFINDPTKCAYYDRWDATLPPRGPAGRYSSLWTWALGINHASRHKKAAWLFIQWASSEPIEGLMGPNCTPSRLVLWETEPFQKLRAQGWVKAAKWYWKHGVVTEPLIPKFREVGEVMSVAFLDILRGAPVKETLSKACKEVDKILG